MNHIFISYSKKNKQYAEKLTQELIRHGFDVWIDNRIDYGEDWFEAIVTAIENCAAVVVIMTPESKGSKWVQREITLADQLDKPIFPLLLSGENWPIFVRTQYSDVTDKNLPADGFYTRLATLIPPKHHPGELIVISQTERPRSRSLFWTITTVGIGILIIIVFFMNVLKDDDKSLTSAKQTFTATTQNFSPTITQLLPALSDFPENKIILSLGQSGYSEIYAMQPNGNNLQKLTDNISEDITPILSPSGQYIAFASSRDGNFEIYLMDASGRNTQRLTSNTAYDAGPSWALNEEQLVFYSDRHGNFELYTMDKDGQNVQRLTDNEASDVSPSWLEDQIVFASDRDGNFEIYLMEGENLKRLTENTSDDIDPRWSPDGQHIAFASNRNGNFEIYRMDKDGNNLIQLTKHGINSRFPQWLPDGQSLAFLVYENREPLPYLIDINDHSLQLLIKANTPTPRPNIFD
ncbi:MAG: TIR domain-containing protein [Anaerolineae bacterium]|nr:TIR domain-containing protein [Anaerolineae bacterium]